MDYIIINIINQGILSISFYALDIDLSTYISLTRYRSIDNVAKPTYQSRSSISIPYQIYPLNVLR